jgi:WhiB family redox-sensing transcriptional regulator
VVPGVAPERNFKEVIFRMNLSWRNRAACKGVDPDIFYPVSDEEAEEAKAICALCPVREACLE